LRRFTDHISRIHPPSPTSLRIKLGRVERLRRGRLGNQGYGRGAGGGRDLGGVPGFRDRKV